MLHESPAVQPPAWDKLTLALVAIVFLTEAAIAVVFLAIVPQYPVHLLESTVSRTEVTGERLLALGAAFSGYMLSAYGGGKLVGQPVWGWFIDRHGSRTPLLAGIGGSLISAVALMLLSNLIALIALSVVYGIAIAVVWPAALAVIGSAREVRQRGRISSGINGAQVAGTGFGLAAGVVLIEHSGFASAFVLAGACAAVALLLTAAVRPRGSAGDEQMHRAGDVAQAAERVSRGGLRLPAGLLLATLILALVSLSVSVLAPDLNPYSAALGLSYARFVLLLAIPAAAGALTLYPAGVLADRYGRSLPSLVAAAIWSLGMIILSVFTAPLLVVIVGSVAAGAYALGLPAWSASLIDSSIEGRRGLHAGFASSMVAIGTAAGPALGGQVILRFGALAPFRISAVFMIAALACAIVYRPKETPCPAK